MTLGEAVAGVVAVASVGCWVGVCVAVGVAVLSVLIIGWRGSYYASDFSTLARQANFVESQHEQLNALIDDLEVRLLIEHQPHAVASHPVIVRQQDPDAHCPPFLGQRVEVTRALTSDPDARSAPALHKHGTEVQRRGKCPRRLIGERMRPGAQEYEHVSTACLRALRRG